MECSHKSFSNKKATKEIFDLKFETKTSVCNDCGAYLRDDEYEKKYLSWLEQVYKDRRDKFQTQCHFSKKLIKCAENYLEDYPGISSTVFMRALVTIYLNIIDMDEVKSEQLESLLDAEIYESFQNDKDRKKINIQFKPNMMIDLIAVSEVIDMRPAALVEEIVLKLMTVITSQDQKLRSFWESEIKSYLDMFLKAA
ncbi:MAG: hypothetical protein KAG61_04465 [Bacteriovoracaceae bacterium]|nr:hypothetical protein [Bacteriovoracaceae bacterium]